MAFNASRDALSATLRRYGTVLRIYDNGGESADRYTIVPPRWAKDQRCTRANGWGAQADARLFTAIGASADPYAPQGIGLTTTAMPGPHLGKRITWDQLPTDVQRFAAEIFPDFCPREDHQLDLLESPLPSPRWIPTPAMQPAISVTPVLL